MLVLYLDLMRRFWRKVVSVSDRCSDFAGKRAICYAVAQECTKKGKPTTARWVMKHSRFEIVE